jgi:transcriptional regulator of arginine metabolism
MTADRRKRHLKILELISTRPIHTQEELAEALGTEGWAVTQSSVSRDITALRLVKVDGIYVRPAEAMQRTRDPDELRLAEGVLTVDLAGEALIVVHTPPGEANRVGAALDRLSWSEIVGTIAGDDTIFLAVQDRKAQREVARRLRDIAVTPASG